MSRSPTRRTISLLLSLMLANASPGPVVAQEPVAQSKSTKGEWRKAGSGRKAKGSGQRAEGQNGDSLEQAVLVIRQATTGRLAESSSRAQAASNPQLLPARSPSLSGPRLSAASPPPALTIEELEQIARGNNPTLSQALAAIDAARARQIQAGLYPNPVVGYQASEIGNEGRAGQQGIFVEQEIVRGGKRRLSRTIAEFEYEQAQSQAEAQMLRVLNSVRMLFYETLAADRASELTQELVKYAEHGVRIAELRQKAGEGTATELLQSQIELEQVRILAANASEAYLAAWQRLAAMVGTPEILPTPLAGSLEAGDLDRDRLATLEKLLAESPEVRSAETAIQRAHAAVERARFEHVPNLTIQAGTQYDFATKTQITNAGLSLPLPLFNRNQGTVLAAESELLTAHRELDRVKLALRDHFASAFARYRNALEQVQRYGTRLSDEEVRQILELKGDALRERMDAHPQILPRSQLALALATEGWRRGEFDYVHVLTAQRTLVQTSLATIRSLGELRQSIVVLDGLLLTDGLVNPAGSILRSGASRSVGLSD